MRPPLLPEGSVLRSSAAAWTTTAAEARYRIDRPISGRSARVIALDAAAADVVLRVAELPWGASRFYPDASTFDLSSDLDDADVRTFRRPEPFQFAF